jgi:hypothetical protein
MKNLQQIDNQYGSSPLDRRIKSRTVATLGRMTTMAMADGRDGKLDVF